VQGNPWLAAGSARVILNEVNSVHPSQLKGWVEVAGPRAEVVIANPAGIQVNGAGFINASGVTLTTGAPVFNAGALEAYRVQGGQVTIEGSGLDARGADATAVLARAVKVNAGLWAQRLTMVTGANTVAASGPAVPAAATPAVGDVPAFALDVAQIGGMYAGHTRDKVWFEGLYSRGTGGEVSLAQYKLEVQTYLRFLANPERKTIGVPFPDR
jgi:filamentous hemagglutinin